MKIISRTLASAVMAVSSSLAMASSINPDNYPALDERQIGHLNYFVDHSQGPVDGWDQRMSVMGGTDLRYTLSWAGAAIALAQHQYTPAYRELYQKTMNNLIQQMTHPSAWDYWYELSRVVDPMDPGAGTQDPWADPIVKDNIMYSGPLFQLLGFYRVLYNDERYDKPGSIALKFENEEVGKQTFTYSYKSIGKNLVEQYSKNEYHGIACEPNLVFSYCNQLPLAAFLHYDAAYGTDYAPQIKKQYDQIAEEKGFFLEDRQVFHTFHRENTRQVITSPTTIDPASMLWERIWNKDKMEAAYRHNREQWVEYLTSGQLAGLTRDGSGALAQVANFAAEIGDRETVDVLFRYAENHFYPTRDGIRFHFATHNLPMPEGLTFQEEMALLFTNPQKLEGVEEHSFKPEANSMMAVARLNNGDAWRNIYRSTWDQNFFSQPYIAGVDYPRTLVTRAVYDGRIDALVITLIPGQDARKRTSFDVHNLDPNKDYAVVINGSDVGHIKNGKASLKGGSKASWKADVLGLEVDLEADLSVVIHPI